MSDEVMPAGETLARGLVLVERAEGYGMIALRGDLGSAEVAAAVSQAVGLEVPGRRGLLDDGTRAVAWMSPDELLLMLPLDDLPVALAAMQAALAGAFALAVDVSDARALFRLRGSSWRDVLAKLCPVDFAPDAFGPGTIRRTRAAQVAAAVWQSGDAEASLICFRSVAGYVGTLLATAAHPSGAVGLHDRPARVSGATP